MSYTVVWKPAAEEELAQLWTDADDRNAVTAAADEIDRLLRSSPHKQGESRRGSVRVVFIDPIGVFFDVQDQDRLVSVLRVWRVP
ncbi:MAG: type II toxin-antitoxin system RelE/ParE family toxin [Planctomycetota bacterium]|jgi:plasmid stabilization system protein ParE